MYFENFDGLIFEIATCFGPLLFPYIPNLLYPKNVFFFSQFATVKSLFFYGIQGSKSSNYVTIYRINLRE